MSYVPISPLKKSENYLRASKCVIGLKYSNFLVNMDGLQWVMWVNQLGVNATPVASNTGNAADSVIPGFELIKVKHEVIRDRQQVVVAITPFGRPIHKFNCALELVVGLRDAIKSHMSLLKDAKILHRDISVNNIILIGPDDTTNYGGRLIDLDLATLFKDGIEQGKKGVITGTAQFMALEISTLR